MALELSSEELQALEQTRQRVAQLVNASDSLRQTIAQQSTLMPWPSLQSLCTIIAQHLASLHTHLDEHKELFASLAVHPLPSFPGRTQEALLGQLIRKKPEPTVEDWMSEGRKATDAVVHPSTSSTSNLTSTATTTAGKTQGVVPSTSDSKASNSTPSDMDLPSLAALWQWAGQAANEQARKHDWGGNYTLREREMGVRNVVTGLKRRMSSGDDDSDSDNENDDDEDDDGGDGDGDGKEGSAIREKDASQDHDPQISQEDKMQGVLAQSSAPDRLPRTPMMPLALQLKFLTTGVLPG